jgi:uncharacterized protein YbjT (DUF2867 family)
MLVLVVGATGVLGHETVRCLRAAGHRVRGMTRRVQRMRDLESLGVEPMIGDLTDRPSLVRACAGVECVFAAAHGLLSRGRNRSEAVDDVGHRSLIAVARDAGVARFVYTSALGAASDHPIDFFRTKWAIEQCLASSGLAYVVLRPSALMEWHAHTFNGKGILDNGRTVILGTGTKRRNFVAARDVAAIATTALTGEMPRERVIAIGGPGDFTNDEVAQMYARIAGVPARITHVPRAALRAVGAIAQPFHPGVGRVMHIASQPDDAFSETFDGDSTRERTIGPTSLEAFVRERVAEHLPR